MMRLKPSGKFFIIEHYYIYKWRCQEQQGREMGAYGYHCNRLQLKLLVVICSQVYLQ